MRIAFLGQPGTFSEQAAHEYFGTFDPLSCLSFDAVFDSVEAGACDAAVIPIENSQAGSVHQNVDLLLNRNAHIIGETVLRVRHCLIALPGAEKNDIRIVVSHSQALAQCARYLHGLRVQTQIVVDTVSGVKLLAERGDRTLAAIASRRAAELNAMSILEEDIEDDPNNHTRFFIIARDPEIPTGAAKTSLTFTLVNQPGALFHALAGFSRNHVDITRIESHPLQNEGWHYRFYLDVLGASNEPRVQTALDELRQNAIAVRILGSYPPAETGRHKPHLDATPPLA